MNPRSIDSARLPSGSEIGQAGRGLSKVPQVAVIFWVIKVLSTGMGETTSDYLVHRFDPVSAVLVVGVCFVAALGLQFLVRRYRPPVYWLAVVMVSVFGTMVADVIHIRLGVSYAVSTIGLSVGLAAVFAAWFVVEGTLSIHSIHTTRRECFYWLTVLTTFALGTAAGDMTAQTLHLGYFSSGLLFAALIVVPLIGHWRFGMNAIVAFWFAYILTRPLGASFADWVAVPPGRGGLGWGTGWISVVLALAIIVLVGLLSLTHTDVEESAAPLSD